MSEFVVLKRRTSVVLEVKFAKQHGIAVVFVESVSVTGRTRMSYSGNLSDEMKKTVDEPVGTTGFLAERHLCSPTDKCS